VRVTSKCATAGNSSAWDAELNTSGQKTAITDTQRKADLRMSRVTKVIVKDCSVCLMFIAFSRG
ncbi:hypothetical protein, partial [Rhodopirellula bahusiensis]|uniref:hypothetical protein n=1 Tax=Rhodopirellula bahusiensis TaxID=2014065 RepID=UPI0032665A11